MNPRHIAQRNHIPLCQIELQQAQDLQHQQDLHAAHLQHQNDLHAAQLQHQNNLRGNDEELMEYERDLFALQIQAIQQQEEAAAAHAAQLLYAEQQEQFRQQNLPRGRKQYKEPPRRQSIGSMDIQCPKCHALHFKGERLSKSTVANSKFGMCCLQGQVQLERFQDPPAELRDLLYGRSPLSTIFKKDIR